MISQWRLPPELGGTVVNPTEAVSPELASMRKVRVPGTEWTVYVPAVCLVPVLPEQPPALSVALAVKAGRWVIFQRSGAGLAGDEGWVQPGGTTVYSWHWMHREYEQVHVLLWCDLGLASAGTDVPGIRVPSALVIKEAEYDEPGTSRVRVTGATQQVFLDREGALAAVRGLLGSAMREYMA